MALKSSGKSECMVALLSNHRAVTAPETYQSASYMPSQRIPQPPSLIQYPFDIRRRTIEISASNIACYPFIYKMENYNCKVLGFNKYAIKIINHTKTSMYNEYILIFIIFPLIYYNNILHI